MLSTENMTADKPKPRAREALGIKIGPLLSPGPLNSITDVPRVRVGMAQAESPKDITDKAYSQAGVTAIGTSDIYANPLFAGIHSLQGAGEMTGYRFKISSDKRYTLIFLCLCRSIYIEEGGQLSTPIMITATQAVGQVYSGGQ